MLRKSTFILLLCMLATHALRAQTYMNFTIQQPAPLFAGFTASPNGLSVAFTGHNAGGITTWAWDFGDGGTSTLQNPIHTFGEGPQIVCLTVGDVFGCTATSCDTILLVGLETADPLAGISIYPNPITAQSVLAFDLDRVAMVKVELLNVLGQSLRTICNEELAAGEHVMPLHIDLPAGIYLLRISNDAMRKTIRIQNVR